LVQVVGQLAGDLSVGSQDVVSMATAMSGSHDIYLAPIDPSGVMIDALRRFGGGTDQEPVSIVVDPGGNVLFTGYITGAVDFGNQMLMTSGPTVRQAFLAKFGGGQNLYGEAWGPGFNVGMSIAADSGSNILIAGAALGTVNFGGMDIPNPGMSAPFVVKLTSAGKHVWSHGYGDPATGKTSTLVAADPKTQQVILGISFDGTVDLGKGKLTAPAAAPAFVVAKLAP
jgi:hypothetical protein